MITTCTSSTGTQLSTLAAFKAALRVTTTADDDLMDTYLTMASEAVEQYLGYSLRRGVYSETVPAGGDNLLMLSQTPVQAIESLSYDGDELSSTDYSIDDPDAGLIWRDYGFPWTAQVQAELSERPVPGSERRAYTCVYEAGYVLAGSTTTDGWVTVTTGRTLPHWAERATLETAKTWFKQTAVDASIQSKRIGDLSITYQSGNSVRAIEEIPPSAAALLAARVRTI